MLQERTLQFSFLVQADAADFAFRRKHVCETFDVINEISAA